ncbi:MAG: class I mannose-6-phosphate isomerase [Bacteroidales bacterium]|nr:class I mannose-6-phosphate isomerase [Bacteroidales bacterium]
MENETKKLPPLKFLPDKAEMPWGTVEYRIADLGFVDSMVSGGWLGGNTLSDIIQTYLERLSGETAFEWYGTQFPVMVKHLDVKGRTSLHVNPDDESAEQRYDAFGKTALWYVEDAGENARLYLGFKRDVTASEFYEACRSNNIAPLLHTVTPRKGESYLIVPGLVHAAKDVKLLEIAECSELWFRLHDWGSSDREMHLEEAIDLVDFRAWKKVLPPEGASVPQFAVNRIELKDPLQNSSEGLEDTFLIYICISGSAVIDVPEEGKTSLKKGEVVLIPAETDRFFLIPNQRDTVLMEVRMEPRPTEEPAAEVTEE